MLTDGQGIRTNYKKSKGERCPPRRLSIPCSPRDPRFVGSNPTEVDGFFQDVKILSTSPPGGTLSRGPESEISGSLKNLKPEKNRPPSLI